MNNYRVYRNSETNGIMIMASGKMKIENCEFSKSLSCIEIGNYKSLSGFTKRFIKNQKYGI